MDKRTVYVKATALAEGDRIRYGVGNYPAGDTGMGELTYVVVERFKSDVTGLNTAVVWGTANGADGREHRVIFGGEAMVAKFVPWTLPELEAAIAETWEYMSEPRTLGECDRDYDALEAMSDRYAYLLELRLELASAHNASL